MAYLGAPRPSITGTRSLCIGATPPWNWQGPNVETHILAPLHVASLSDTEGRRIIFGRPLSTLPAGWPNPVNHITRVVDASAVTDASIDTAAHIATRRAPRGNLVKTIRSIAELTSAGQYFET